MATELSALGVKITSTGVVTTTNQLDKFTVAATAAGKAAKPINVKVDSAGVTRALADIQRVNQAMKSMGGTSPNIAKSSGALNNSAIAAQKLAAAQSRAEAAQNRTAASAINLAASQSRAEAAQSRAAAAAAANAKSQLALAQAQDRAAKGGGAVANTGAGGAASTLLGTVRQLIGAYAVLQGVQAYAKLTDESKMLTAQLKLATSETGSFAQAQKDVRAIATAVRTDLDSTAALYGKLMINSKQLGITQLEAARATETVAKAFKVSGASTVEASQGTRQLVQALQSGVLRGDEFNTMSEAAPRLQKLLADSLGVTQGALRKMAEEGELTSDKLTKAFTDKKFTAALDREFDQLPVTFGDAMTQIRNAAVITFGAFDEGGQFSTSITKFLIGGTKGMADWENAARTLGNTIAVEFSRIGGFFDAIQQSINMVSSAFSYLSGLPVISPVVRWLGDVISQVNTLASYLNPITVLFNTIGRVGQKAADAKQRELNTKSLADASAFQATEAFKRQRDNSAIINRNTAATVKATKATKGMSDAEREAKRAADELKRAYEQKVKAADDYIASLQKENAEFGKSAKEIRLMEVARRMEAAATDEQRKAIEAASNAREMNIGTKELTEAKKLSDQRERDIQLIKDETELQRKAGTARMAALKGLSGDALENELARINDEYEIQNIMLRAQADAAADAANAVHILAKAHAEVAQVRLQQGQANDERTFDQDRRRALDTANQIGDVIGGKIGNSIGDLADAMDKLAPELTAKIGDALGSGFGDAMGAFGAAVAANKAIGKIFGFKGGPLGIFTGLLTKTPKASASINAVAGEFMDTIVKGTKSKLKEAALTMANTVIDGLKQISDALGAELAGNARVSIGLRKGNYRVDPTGQGRTKGSGVVDFGKDEAAAIAFALQDAIRDGVLDGLSESMKRLIMADGDFQAQLAKALSFKSVFDELAQKDDPAKWAQDQVTKWHDAMAKIFAEAGATADELAELERLTGIKRTEAAAEATKEADAKIAELAKSRRDLQIQIMELEGKAVEALAATRAVEMAELDASLRPLQERVYALQDEADAVDKANQAAAKAAEDQAGYRELEIQFMEARGRKEQAEAARRADTLAGLDSYSQALQKLIWAANEAAARETERAGLQERIDQMMGNTAAIRERELSAVDASNRALVERIHMLEDEAKAAEAARAIADQADGLQGRWLQLIGDTAALRERELAALDPSNRALLQRIFAEEDRQAAAEAATKAQEEYISSLNEAAGNLGQVAERMRGFAKEIREFKSTLFADANQGGDSYGRVAEQFRSTSRMAALGNENSLASFVGDAQAFLDAARDNARSSLDYRRAVSEVAGASDRAIGGAEGLASNAEQQVAALNATVAQLQSVAALGASQVSLADLANQIQTGQVVPAIEDTVGGGLEALRAEVIMLRRELQERRDEEKAEALAIARNTSATAANLERVTRNGDTLAMTAEDGVSINNPVTSPVPTLEVTP